MKGKSLIAVTALIIFLSMVILCELAAAAEKKSVTLKKGTTMVVRLSTALDSKTTKQGEWFNAELVEPVTYGQYTVLPKGSLVHAIVDKVTQPKMNVTHASIKIVFDRIETPDGRIIPINAKIHRDLDVVKNVNKAGGAAGDFFGNQALNAATGGALTPFLIADDVRKGQEFMNKDKNVALAAGTILHIALKKPATIPLDPMTAREVSENALQKAKDQYKRERKAHHFDGVKKGIKEEIGIAVKTPLKETIDTIGNALQNEDNGL